MLTNKNSRTISVRQMEHDELIKMIENMDGVSIRKTSTGIEISIHKARLEKVSVGGCIRKKNKKGKRVEHLTSIRGIGEDANGPLEFRQSSAIIAKPI